MLEAFREALEHPAQRVQFYTLTIHHRGYVVVGGSPFQGKTRRPYDSHLPSPMTDRSSRRQSCYSKPGSNSGPNPIGAEWPLVPLLAHTPDSAGHPRTAKQIVGQVAALNDTEGVTTPEAEDRTGLPRREF